MRATDEIVKRHYQFNGHETEQSPGDSEGQEGLACCSPWGHIVRHDLVTEQQWLQTVEDLSLPGTTELLAN